MPTSGPPVSPAFFRLSPTVRLSAAVAVVAALFTAPTRAQRADRPGAPNTSPNIDIRIDGDPAATAYLARTVAPITAARALQVRSRAAGIARLRADFRTVDVVNSRELGTPEVVRVRPGTGFLGRPTADRPAAMRAFLSDYADAYGLSPAEVTSLDVLASYENPSGNMSWVELEQRINGLPVFRGLIRGGFTRNGELTAVTGQLAGGFDAAALAPRAALTAEQAVAGAAVSVGWTVAAAALVRVAINGSRVTFARGPMADEAKAWLVYFPLAPGVARLAWATEIWGSPDAYLVLLDAEDGTVVFRKNLTNFQTQSATYNVYNNDGPAPLSPSNVLPGSGTQAPFISRTSITLVGNEAPNTFNNLGWLTDGSNTTDGNNVQAGIDRDGTNGVDATVAGVNRVFNFAFDPQTDDPLTPSYQKGEVTDVFFWTNTYHDRLYLLGFTEAAHNFQNDNFGRGGVAGDRISAEAQDSSGTNNATFSTPSDGGRGRMQMFIFTGPTPHRTSGIDHDVLLHELTHGTSNRLHSNGSGLNTTMSAGMGEGWSDFYARALLSTADEDVNGIYPSGSWITNLISPEFTDNYYYGIRRFPYAVRSTVGGNGRPHNPLTFADIDSTQIDLSDAAFPPAFVGSAFEVHNVGEVWAMALFEVRARFISRLGFETGNQRILQFVTDGMKLDPPSPTFLQGRDSILAAANAGGGTLADIVDIWAGFAVRGMGVSAQVLDAATGSVVEAFDVPGLTAGTGTLVTESIPNGRVDPAELVTVSLCITNTASTSSSSVTGTLLAGGGVLSPSASQSFGAIASSADVCRNFTFTVGSAPGSTLAAALQVQEAGAATRTLFYGFQVGSGLLQDFDTAIVPVLPPSWSSVRLSGRPNAWTIVSGSAASPPNSAFVADPGAVSDNALTTPAFTMPTGPSRLSFRHTFNTELNFDGGVLEIAIGGGTFQDILAAGGSMTTGGYTAAIIVGSGNPIAGRQAWTGSQAGFLTTLVDMPASTAGQSVRLRWRMTSDSGTGGTGWFVDSITLAATAPTIVSIVPNSGPSTGGTPIVITGTNFGGGASVAVGGVAATGITVVNSSTITATTAAHAAGQVNVVVTNPDLQSGTASNAFTFVAPTPFTTTAIAPAFGPTAGGTPVTITGTGFVAGATVTIGGTPATNVIVSSTVITAVTGAHAAGLFNVVVTNGDAQIGTLSNAFTYLAPPSVLSITPAFGPAAGDTAVTIGGTGFVFGASVTIGGVAATVTAVNSTTITAVTGARAAGLVSVVVTNADAQSSTLTSGFSYSTGAAPTVASILPNSGPMAGGTAVTIAGTNFLVGVTVSIGGVAAANVSLQSATSLTATTGAHAAGLVNVTVTNPDAQPGTLINGFAYVEPSAPSPSPSPSPEPSPSPSPPPTPQPPDAPINLSSAISGSTVTLSWSAPPSAATSGEVGSAPTSYTIEAGSSAGESNLATLITGSTATTIRVEAVPAGVYFVRVRATNALGTSPPSNEVVVAVGVVVDAGAPGVPTGLAASLSGSTLTLAWSAPGNGGSLTAYRIEAGSAPGLSNVASFSTGSTATTFSVGNVPAGTYFVRVRATNAVAVSAPSNEVIITVTSSGPCSGPPSAPTGLTFTRNGSTVTLTWNASAGGPTTYVIEAGTFSGATNVANVDTGSTSTGLSAVASAGTYFVRVRGRNACGPSGPSNEVAIVVP